MSRSTVAKSRTDKAGKAVNAPTPAVAHEIVPGKFTDKDWNFMLECDDGDDYAAEIVEELCSTALDKIYENYLQKQLIPFTILQAKEALLQIVEWQFLERDEGEETSDLAELTEDEEPVPAVTDCWAQGSVPKNFIMPSQGTPIPPVIEEAEEELISETPIEKKMFEKIKESDAQIGDEDQYKVEPQQQNENTLVIEETIEESADKVNAEEPKIIKNRKKKFKKYQGAVKSDNFGKLTESLEQTEMEMFHKDLPSPPAPKTPDTAIFNMPDSCYSIVKLQAGRPPGTRDIVYDPAGNIVSMAKINPESLPSNSVKTRFRIIDPQVEAAQSQLEAMRTGKHLKNKKPIISKPIKRTRADGEDYQIRRDAEKSHHTNNLRSDATITPLPHPLIDSMEVSAGVVVKERDRIKRGPKQVVPKSELTIRANRNLRPIALKTGSQLFTVQDLLGNQESVVKIISADSPAIPPIIPRPPVQQKTV